MEFFLNRAELSLKSVNSGNLKITEVMNWAQFKDPVSTCVLLVLSHKRWLCGRFKPFYCDDKYFCH